MFSLNLCGYQTVKEPVNVTLELTKKVLRIDARCLHPGQQYGELMFISKEVTKRFKHWNIT